MVTGASELPAPMAALHRGWTSERIWRNQVTTWRLRHEDGRTRFLKAGPPGWWPGLRAEAERISWAHDHRLPVPEVLDFGGDAEQEWLLTSGLPGRHITNDQLRERTEVIVPLLAQAMRRFHDTPRDDCPFDFRTDTALEVVRGRVAGGLFDRDRGLDPVFFPGLTPEAAVERLERIRPAADDLVLCHGDFCPPNVLVADDRVVGVVDLCDLGVADRWRDLAICPWAFPQLGPEAEELFYRSYGVDPDPDRIAFHRLLYDLGRLLMTGRENLADSPAGTHGDRAGPA